MTKPSPIRLAVMMYVRFPLSLRQVEDILHERGIDVSYEIPVFSSSDMRGKFHCYRGLSSSAQRNE
jgi:transposase-like protein